MVLLEPPADVPRLLRSTSPSLALLGRGPGGEAQPHRRSVKATGVVVPGTSVG